MKIIIKSPVNPYIYIYIPIKSPTSIPMKIMKSLHHQVENDWWARRRQVVVQGDGRVAMWLYNQQYCGYIFGFP